MKGIKLVDQLERGDSCEDAAKSQLKSTRGSLRGRPDWQQVNRMNGLRNLELGRAEGMGKDERMWKQIGHCRGRRQRQRLARQNMTMEREEGRKQNQEDPLRSHQHKEIPRSYQTDHIKHRPTCTISCAMSIIRTKKIYLNTINLTEIKQI
ncbi:hypothetical protein WR25_07638 [Diploscapter pachys]|uniref:Uncharacterized protein n=1 Tax=Diploscapter pachys TaxID=2018661 RepID=A0A2A2KYB1_9BILA|nr:hypothetical protein WR25_07638 [Diploscapter pachys]